jgi:anti-sigma B factor antagonist
MNPEPAYRWMTVEPVGNVTVVRITLAEIWDEKTAEQIGQQLVDLVVKQGCRQLILNFSQVRMMTSTMLAKLLGLRKRMDAVGGRLALCETHPELHEVLDTLRLPQLFSIYEEEGQALHAQRSAPLASDL